MIRSMKREKGFALIEVIIAIALLGIIAAGFLMALSGVSKALVLADERTTAESLARSQMEYAKDQDYITVPGEGVGPYEASYQKISGIPGGYTIWSEDYSGTIVEVEDIIYGVPWDSQAYQPVDLDIDTDSGLQRIYLVIQHNGEDVITLESYKVNR